jgi:hypothetical protein
MIGMMLIVAARWVQLSKEEFASAANSGHQVSAESSAWVGPGAVSNDVSVWRLLVLA